MANLPEFKEKKTSQLAALLISKAGGEYDMYKLLKLLYMVDRESLCRRGHPVTYDAPYSMRSGPVLSGTYDIIKGARSGEDWGQIFNERVPSYTISLRNVDLVFGELSKADIEIANEIFDEFGHLSGGELKEITHQFPEFEEPENNSSKPINIRTILESAKWEEEEIEEAFQDLDHMAWFETVIR
jgi:uncharacterized phage-associated protein